MANIREVIELSLEEQANETMPEFISVQLDICKHVLPDALNHLHRERIDYLVDWFDESLP